jgi:hypothetical protein
MSEASGQRTVLKVRGIDKLPSDDLRAFVACADALGINPDWLACVVAFETGGSWSPSQRNHWAAKDAEKRGLPYSGAMGLVQFMPSTAKNLGTSTAELAAMTFAEQLKYVRAYLAPYASRIKSLDDCYLAVFYPAAIGREDSYRVGIRGAEGFIGRVYEQNAGFDRNKNGDVTKAEICKTIRDVRDAAGGVRLALPSDDVPFDDATRAHVAGQIAVSLRDMAREADDEARADTEPAPPPKPDDVA